MPPHSPVALISGAAGMDGSHLADLLLYKGYYVHGIVRRPLCEQMENIEHCRDRMILHQADMKDTMRLSHLIRDIKPTEIYNFASVSYVPASWEQREEVTSVNAFAVGSLLDAMRDHVPDARFYQASSSEMFGNAPAPQNEDTPMHPVSPYGVAKLYAHNLVRTYRERYGLFAVSGICFNHEGPRRAKHFVTRKVCDTVAAIEAGKTDHIVLGNLDAQRDWGYAPDYVGAMWMMLQAPEPRDYVIATGKTNSVRALVRTAFDCINVPNWTLHVVESTSLLRKNEIHKLLGDARLIYDHLSWKPETSFENMVRLMVCAARERL